jgi:hypothetical protein
VVEASDVRFGSVELLQQTDYNRHRVLSHKTLAATNGVLCRRGEILASFDYIVEHSIRSCELFESISGPGTIGPKRLGQDTEP